MYSKLSNKKILVTACLLGLAIFIQAQNNRPYFKDALKEKRTVFYNNIVKSINKTLALPINNNTEDAWINTINNINLIKYNPPFVKSRIDEAVNNILPRSNTFKKAILELINTEYPIKYAPQIKAVFNTPTDDVKLIAMAASYILPVSTISERKLMLQQTTLLLAKDRQNAVLYELTEQIKNYNTKINLPSIKCTYALLATRLPPGVG